MSAAGDVVGMTFNALQYTIAVGIGIGMFAVVNVLGDAITGTVKGRLL